MTLRILILPSGWYEVWRRDLVAFSTSQSEVDPEERCILRTRREQLVLALLEEVLADGDQ